MPKDEKTTEAKLAEAEDKIAKLAENIFALKRNLPQIQTSGTSSIIMVECFKIVDGSLMILRGDKQ